jgi:hypothetical protein
MNKARKDKEAAVESRKKNKVARVNFLAQK